jgi:isoprenylcysteine carboxyl methyltransferase (ICMT) family protein YpbQ
MSGMIAGAIGAVLFRLATLVVSIRNQRRLQARGAVEIGALNSSIMAALHTAFYLAAIAEGAIRGPALDVISLIGIVLYLFGAVMLIVVMRELGPLWTVRVFIAPDHVLNTRWLFRVVRHPNYYLAILPELVGLALAFHAGLTLAIGLPLYLVSMVVRIRQEEAAMQAKFAQRAASSR